MHEYGKTNWEHLWEKLEQSGNVGLDHVINPLLYARILNFLANHPKAIVADFGCGTNLMGIQLLFGYEQSIPALLDNPDVGHARFNTLLYIGVEGSEELVDQSNRYLADIGQPKNIATVQSHIDKNIRLFDEHSIDLCVSRNFLMHLSAEELDAHFAYVASILKPGGAYIFATLNPAYELKKIAELRGRGGDAAHADGVDGEGAAAPSKVKNGDHYDFMHGKAGEYGTFYHYYKTPEFWQETIEKYFTIVSKQACRPISDTFRESHGRYYEGEAMADVWVLIRTV